jgi:branched-chain amino acid transport system substrate-binding protein
VPTISIIHTSSVYGRGFANPLSDELVRRGFLAPVHPFDADDVAKRTAALRAAENAQPRATVIIANTANAVELVKEARTSMPLLTRDAGHRWYLTDSMKEQTLITPDTAGELEGSVGTAPAQGAGSGYSVFREAYRTRFGTDPDTTNYTSHSYDATWLVMLATQYALGNAMTLGAVTGPRLGEGMTRFALSTGPSIPLRSDKWSELADNLARGTPTNVEGASGPLDFSVDAGAPGAPYEIWKVTDGGIRVLRQVWP